MEFNEYDGKLLKSLGLEYVNWYSIRPRSYYSDDQMSHIRQIGGKRTLCGIMLSGKWMVKGEEDCGSAVLCARCTKSAKSKAPHHEL